MTTFPKVHIHTSSTNAFYVNSFIIEGARSLVLVDTQFVLSEARLVADKVVALEQLRRRFEEFPSTSIASDYDIWQP